MEKLDLEKYPHLKRKSFAENLRRALSAIIHIPVDQTRTIEDKNVFLNEFDMTVGRLLQLFGTEVGRVIHPDIWVISLFMQFDASHDFWIIDDVRFVNEADAIKKHGGILIRLEGDPGNIIESSKRNLNHESETALDDYHGFDVIIHTNNYINQLDAMLQLILQ